MKFKIRQLNLLILCLLQACANNTQPLNANKMPNTAPIVMKVKNVPLVSNSQSSTITNDSPKNYSYNPNSNIPLFINDFIKAHPKIKAHDFIANLLLSQQPNQAVINLMIPSKEIKRKNWQVYRSRFIEPIRVNAGKQFINTHKEILEKVQAEFGVDYHIIAAVIGVETIYGKYIGNFNVLNTLYTLAFYYPDTPNKNQRELMFQHQLADYIIWAQEQGNFNHIGSYAGAMGMPQFMPSSILNYAVDYDKDGYINLTSSIADITASIANFLKKHGWKTNEKIVLDVENSYENIALLKANATGKPQANLTFKELPSLKFDYLSFGLSENTPLLVVDLPSGEDIEYKLGLYNFYVLTRYNQSFFYALSVYELAQAISNN